MTESEINQAAKFLALKIAIGYIAKKSGLNARDFETIEDILTPLINETFEHVGLSVEKTEKCLSFAMREIDDVRKISERLS